MRKNAILSLAAMAGFAISLLSLGQQANAKESPLPDGDFWKDATVEDATAATSTGADVDAPGRRGIAPLQYATRFSGPEVVQALLDKGTDVDAGTRSGDTSRDLAESGDNAAAVDRLLDMGLIHPWENPLLKEEFWVLATVGDVIAVIREGADIHARDKEFGGTPLHWAAWWHKDPEVVRQLVIRGADIHAKDTRHEDTPLYWAVVFNENPEVAAMLLDRGADIHERNRYAWTPLHQAAAFSQNPDVVALLLDRGADAAARDQDGNTPFDYVQENEHLQNSRVYRRLEELQYAHARGKPRSSGQQAHALTCPYSKPPAHRGGCAFLNYAYEGYDSHGLRVWQAEDMIAAGADVNAREVSSSGQIYDTPLHIFCSIKNVEVVEVLLKHGADANVSTWTGETPLLATLFLPGHADLSDEAFEYFAHAMYEIVELLLQAGAEVNVQDEDGNTPLLAAYELGDQPIYDILRRYGAK